MNSNIVIKSIQISGNKHCRLVVVSLYNCRRLLVTSVSLVCKLSQNDFFERVHFRPNLALPLHLDSVSSLSCFRINCFP